MIRQAKPSPISQSPCNHLMSFERRQLPQFACPGPWFAACFLGFHQRGFFSVGEDAFSLNAKSTYQNTQGGVFPMPRYSNNNNIQIARPSWASQSLSALMNPIPFHHVVKSSCALTCGRRRYLFLGALQGQGTASRTKQKLGKSINLQRTSYPNQWHTICLV